MYEVDAGFRVQARDKSLHCSVYSWYIVAFMTAQARGRQAVVSHAGAMEDLAAIFGLHIWPFLPTGTLASRPGPIMAAAQQFEARVTGRGGHAGMPPMFVDPILPAAAIIGALQVWHLPACLQYDACVTPSGGHAGMVPLFMGPNLAAAAAAGLRQQWHMLFSDRIPPRFAVVGALQILHMLSLPQSRLPLPLRPRCKCRTCTSFLRPAYCCHHGMVCVWHIAERVQDSKITTAEVQPNSRAAGTVTVTDAGLPRCTSLQCAHAPALV